MVLIGKYSSRGAHSMPLTELLFTVTLHGLDKISFDRVATFSANPFPLLPEHRAVACAVGGSGQKTEMQSVKTGTEVMDATLRPGPSNLPCAIRHDLSAFTSLKLTSTVPLGPAY